MECTVAVAVPTATCDVAIKHSVMPCALTSTPPDMATGGGVEAVGAGLSGGGAGDLSPGCSRRSDWTQCKDSAQRTLPLECVTYELRAVRTLPRLVQVDKGVAIPCARSSY
jgi:hypothetical protein